MDAIDAVVGGSGRLVLLTGPAGAGKTRRATTIATEAHDAGLTVVWAAGGRPGAPPFWPWHQVLRSVPTAPGEPHDQPLPTASAEGERGDLRARFELFEGVVSRLAVAARSAPFVVVLDDLQDADPASLLLLQHVAAVIRSLPVLLVVTARTDVDPEPAEWPQVWADLVRHGEVVAIGPLTEDDVAALLTDETGAAADPDLVHRIAHRTGGNALFVTELVRWCAASGGDVDTLPDTVRAVIAARLARLTPSCRRVLSAAATVGPRAAFDLVVEVLGDAPDEVLAAVDEASRHGVLDGSQPHHVVFAHEIVRDAVYEAQSPVDRARWHRTIGDRLAAAGDAAGAAHHYRHGGSEARAAAGEWFQRAGEESLAVLAYEEAATQLSTALEYGPADPGRVRVQLGSALLAVGDAAGARAQHLAALEQARESADPELMAAAALGLGAGQVGFEVPLFDREQIAGLEDALTLVGEDRPAVRAALLARLAVASTFTADEDRRRALTTEAVSLARGCGDATALAVALASSVDLVAGPDHVDERIALSSEIIELAQGVRDSSLELLGRRQRVVARLERGDVAGAEEDVRDYHAVSATLGQPIYSWYVPLWTAALAFARGEVEDAATALAEAERIGERAGSGNAVMLVLTHRLLASAELGDPQAMRRTVEGLTFDESMGPWVTIARGFFHAACGEVSAARSALDVAVDRLPELPHDSEWLPALTQAAETVQLVGGHPVARWLHDALLPYSRLYVVEGIGALLRGSVERHLGGLAALIGDRAAAEQHFDRAVEANRRVGARLLVARTLHDAATSLGDPDRLAEARALYAEMGVTSRLGRAPTSTPGPSSDNELRHEGETWTLTYAGRRATVRDSKGLRDLSVLLARPGQPVPAVELAAGPGGGARPGATSGAGRGGPDELRAPGDLGEVIDARARRAYRQRLHELEEDAAEADATGDVERSVRVASEREALVEQLSAAYGLGGRPRRAGSPAERARSTVTARIRDSIRRIQAVHPELGRHLSTSVRTGTLCSYEPEGPVTWRLTP